MLTCYGLHFCRTDYIYIYISLSLLHQIEREIAELTDYEGSIRRSNARSYVPLVHESVIVAKWSTGSALRF